MRSKLPKLFYRPSFVAIIFAASLALFFFSYRWVVVSGIFDGVYLWFSSYADVLGILSLIFGVLAVISFIWLLVVAFKREKEETSEIEKLATKLDALIDELKEIKHLQDRNKKDKGRE